MARASKIDDPPQISIESDRILCDPESTEPFRGVAVTDEQVLAVNTQRYASWSRATGELLCSLPVPLSDDRATSAADTAGASSHSSGVRDLAFA